MAFVVLAFITARGRIGVLPAPAAQDSPNPSRVPAALSESAKTFRVLGWFLVLLLYLAAAFCLLQGLNALRIVHHWDLWKAYFGNQLDDRTEIALYSRFWTALAIALIIVGCWAQRRLRRRAQANSPSGH
jgi:uncharacterized membrane protein